jgi:hypothetical protein
MLLQVTNIVITLLTFTVIPSNVITMSVESNPPVDTSTNEDPLTCPTTPEKIYASLSPKDARLFLIKRAKYHQRRQEEEEQHLDEALELVAKAKENLQYHTNKRKEINDKKLNLFNTTPPKMKRTNSS